MKKVNLDAQLYRHNSSPQECLGMEALAIHPFQGDEEVLDIGCGDGRLTAKIAQAVPQGHVRAVDPSPQMLKLAQETYQLPNLSFHMGDAEEFPDETHYDLVTALSSLHWVPDQRRALKRLTSALKPGGHLLILSYPAESPFLTFFRRVLALPRWAVHERRSACRYRLSTEEYLAAVKELGLELIFHRTQRLRGSSLDIETLKRKTRGWLPCMLPLSAQDQELFLEDMGQQAHLLFFDAEEGKLDMYYDHIVLYLRKPV